MGWITANKDALQIIVAVSTAALTAILIAITAFYAYANYATMRIMEADLRSRTQPIPKVGLNVRKFEIQTLDGRDAYSIEVTIESGNAPMLLISVSADLFHVGGDSYTVSFHLDDVQPITIGTKRRLTMSQYTKSGNQIGSKWVTLHYYDLARNFRFETRMIGGNVLYSRMVRTITPLSRGRDIIAGKWRTLKGSIQEMQQTS
jgi:hypothetical protein